MTEYFRDIKWYKRDSIKNCAKKIFLCREIAKRGDKFVIAVDLFGIRFIFIFWACANYYNRCDFFNVIQISTLLREMVKEFYIWDGTKDWWVVVHAHDLSN